MRVMSHRAAALDFSEGVVILVIRVGVTGRVLTDSAPDGAENAQYCTILETDRQSLG